MSDAYSNPYVVAAEASPVERGQFIRRVYFHVAGAILVFAGVEAALLTSPLFKPLMNAMVGNRFSWLVVMALFMGVSWLADKWARSEASKPLQYAGLITYIVALAVVFMPLIGLAVLTDPNTIPMAVCITFSLVLGLTAVVMLTKTDFSFLRGALIIASFVALGTIVASILFGFTLGIFFSALMVLFAGASVLYNTGSIFRTYPTGQYVAASLALFASIALLFWYILQILLSARR